MSADTAVELSALRITDFQEVSKALIRLGEIACSIVITNTSIINSKMTHAIEASMRLGGDSWPRDSNGPLAASLTVDGLVLDNVLALSPRASFR